MDCSTLSSNFITWFLEFLILTQLSWFVYIIKWLFSSWILVLEGELFIFLVHGTLSSLVPARIPTSFLTGFFFVCLFPLSSFFTPSSSGQYFSVCNVCSLVCVIAFVLCCFYKIYFLGYGSHKACIIGLCVGIFNLCKWYCIAELISFPHSALDLKDYPRCPVNIRSLLLTSA